MLISAILFVCISIGYLDGASWNYLDTDQWAKDFKFCRASGGSPINIKTRRVKTSNEVCRSPFSWNIAPPKYGTYRVSNNGHSIVVVPVTNTSHTSPPRGNTASGTHDRRRRLAHGQVREDGYRNLVYNDHTIGVLKNQFGSKKGIHEYFCLHSFHFHWGKDRYHEKGSEHTVNGYSYPLEVHFVHYSCDFDNLTQALENSGKNTTKDKFVLGVIGVFFNISQIPNPAIDKILSDNVISKSKFPQTFGNFSGSALIDGLNILDLIPEKKDLYAYDGSLTTPKCNPIVRWHVMKNEVPVSWKQLDRFTEFFGAPNLSLSDNFRPVQNNTNQVYWCPQNAEHVSHDDNHDGHESAYKGLAANGLAVFLIVAAVIFVCFVVLSIPFIKDCCKGNSSSRSTDSGRKQSMESFSSIGRLQSHGTDTASP